MPASSATHRQSFWADPSSSSTSLDFIKSHRYSTMPTSLFEKIQELEKMRFGLKSSARSALPKDHSLKGSSPRTSSRSRMSGSINAIKGRWVRKRPSASMLAKTIEVPERVASPMHSPTTPSNFASLGMVTFLSSLDTHAYGNGSATYRHYPNSTHGRRPSLRRVSSHADARSVDTDGSFRCFRRLERMKHKDGMTLHPYAKEEAPYMLAYNRVLLQNDDYTHYLLRRLNENSTPTFHDYGSKPPARVLDLGCGQGTWVMEAAASWAQHGTKVVGFDLVDLLDDRAKARTNVEWKWGNFVEFLLPFPSDSFDLVRIANLTLCIPYARWMHVLQEAKRVLAPGGRVEMIDDEIIFPYNTSSRDSSSAASQRLRSSWTGSEQSCSTSVSTNVDNDQPDSFLDLDCPKEVEDDMRAPGLYSGNSPSETSCEDLLTPVDDGRSVASWSPPKRADRSEPVYPLLAETSSLQTCEEVELVFQSMLVTAYGMHLRPHDFLVQALQQVFGRAGQVKKIRSYHLSLVDDDCISEALLSDKNSDRLDSNSLCFDNDATADPRAIERSNQAQLALAHSEGKLTAKAARLLGVATPAADEQSQPSSRSASSDDVSIAATQPHSGLGRKSSGCKTKAQHSGLFLYPNCFLDTTSKELDMYAGKNMHVVLGCKAAMLEHVASLSPDADSSGNIEQLQDMVWTYECTRRERLGLPPSPVLDDDYDDRVLDPVADTPKRPRLLSANLDFAIRRRSGTLGTKVRAIRVFEAHKPVRSHTN